MVLGSRWFGAAVCLLSLIGLFGAPLPDFVVRLTAGYSPLAPASAILFLLLGTLLIVGMYPGRRWRYIRLTLAVCATLLAGALLFPVLRPFGIDLASSLAPPAALAHQHGELDVKPYAAFGIMMLGLIFILYELRETAWTDTWIHVLLMLVTFLAINAQLFALGISLIQIQFRYLGGSLQGMITAELAIVGMWLHWLALRRARASQRTFVLSRRRFVLATVMLLVVNVATGLSFRYSMNRLEPMQRDYFEETQRLQVDMIASALGSARQLAESVASLPLLADAVRSRIGSNATTAELQRAIESMVRRDVRAAAIRGPDGRTLAVAGKPVAAAGFDVQMDYQHRLIWSDGLVLRSEVPVASEGGIGVGLMVIEQQLPAIDRLLESPGQFGGQIVVTLCAPADVAEIQCVAGGPGGHPYRTRRVALGQPGAAASLAVEGRAGSLMGASRDGAAVFTAYGAVERYPLAVLAEIPTSALADTTRGLFLGFLLLAFFLSAWIAALLRVPSSSSGEPAG